jgi:hypothetical protein
MGKKISQLKNKKANILKSMPVPAEEQKVLDRLKMKYETLHKLSK